MFYKLLFIDIQHGWVCVLCVCSFPREFVESQFNDQSYFVAVGTFDDIRQEPNIMPSTHLDKLIIAHLPVYGGSAWENLQRIPLRDMLVFSDTFPGFYRAASPLPPYSGTPPPPPNTYLDNYTPPPPCTPQYSPESPDQDGYSPSGITTFPPYAEYSPSIITFPPTPNAPPQCSTPSAPPRAPPRPRCIPKCRIIYNDDDSSTDEEVKFICDDCRSMPIGLGRGRGCPSYN